MTSVDEFRLDSHKLMFHPLRVSSWLAGETVYPLYMELSPSGACNHRCVFCAKDYRGYRPLFLDSSLLRERLGEFAGLGVKSVMYAGEGEPLLHPDIAAIIGRSRSVGLDVALTTNGVLLAPALAEQILPSLSWVKVSIDAGTAQRYAAIHGTGERDFASVFANLEAAARLIEVNGWSCTLGTQAILLPENAAEMELLARRARDAGARYLVIKPYSQHGMSHTRRYEGLDYRPYLELRDRLEACSGDGFRVVFRLGAMSRQQCSPRGYERCLALPFWSYIDAAGDVWGCSSFIGDERFCYGNIAEETSREIWTGGRRRRSLDFVARELDPGNCRRSCRMDEVNAYLWELTHPGPHVNFI